MPSRTGLPKNPRTQETAPEMPAAKSRRSAPPSKPRTLRAPPASGETKIGSSGHADFLDAVTSGSVRLIGEEKRRGDVPMEPGMRRVQYGVAFGERVVLIRWAEDNSGHWHKTEMNLPSSAIKALVAALDR
jgi:hypothetical protein